MHQPLILTLTLDAGSQKYFNELRKTYFPVERNFLDAHLTLFHQIPADDSDVIRDIKLVAERYSEFKMSVLSIVSIGNGAAFKLECNELSALHKQLQQQWQQWIIPQDRQKIWPHITIQNKVTPEDAKQLIEKLSIDFIPFEITATGLTLWEYLGGPWRFIETYPFGLV